MNRTELIKRRSDLMDVHCWCFENELILTELQLICLTRESVSILHVLDWLREDSNKHVTPEYTLPRSLEVKFQKVLDKIKETNWERGEYFFDEVKREFERKPEYQWIQ